MQRRSETGDQDQIAMFLFFLVRRSSVTRDKGETGDGLIDRTETRPAAVRVFYILPGHEAANCVVLNIDLACFRGRV